MSDIYLNGEKIGEGVHFDLTITNNVVPYPAEDVDLHMPVDVSFTTTIEDRDLYDQVRYGTLMDRWYGEVVGGRWDGLPVVAELPRQAA